MTNIENNVQQAASRLAATLTAEARQRIRLRGRLESLYVKSALHAHVETMVTELVENAAASAEGGSSKRRALFILGESGSGKSTVVEHTLVNRPELQPYTDVNGDRIRPLIAFDAPKPLTLRLFSRKLLEAAGYAFDTSRLREYEVFELAKNVLRERKVSIVFIDEAQHLLKGNDRKTIQNLADTIKSLLQIDGWPLHVVLAGVPTLAQFLEHEPQLRNRSMLVEIETMTFPAHQDRVRTVVEGIIQHHAEMKIAKDLRFDARHDGKDDQIVHKIIRASEGGFGTMIQLVRSACLIAHSENAGAVGIPHFVQAFAQMTGCDDNANIFISSDWATLTPSATVVAIGDKQHAAEKLANVRQNNRQRSTR